jgi:hypothetical protein
VKPYRPSIHRLQLEFAQRLARKRMHQNLRKTNPAPQKTITDNSEPWLKKPDSFADYWFIADQINQVVEKWRPQATTSSAV